MTGGRLIGSGQTATFWVIALLVAVVGASVFVTDPASGRENPRTREAAVPGTPVASQEPENDPLDGTPEDAEQREDDPLDGDLPTELVGAVDEDAPERHDQLVVERSGRPEGAPSSVVAYDDDPETVWSVSEDDDATWLWLDLGEERRVREVRWLTAGSGEIEVSVSNDRERWQAVGESEASRSWQGIELREDARYVRLELLPDVDGAVPEIAEVAVYGRGGDSVAREQDADGDRDRKRKRNRRAGGDRNERRSEQKAQPEESSEDRKERKRGKRKRSGERASVSAQEGETSCKGKGNRCRARKGQVSIEEDCQDAGTCTIDVNVDGGTAMCDASGGSRAKAGDGEGRRGGEGGRCEAVADGGAVSIGDINP